MIRGGKPLRGEVTGVLVTQVEQGSRAFNNGLEAGDIITAANRRPVRTAAELEAMLQGNTADALNIVRGDTELFLIVR